MEGLYEKESCQRCEIAEKAGLADCYANALQGTAQHIHICWKSLLKRRSQLFVYISDVHIKSIASTICKQTADIPTYNL